MKDFLDFPIDININERLRSVAQVAKDEFRRWYSGGTTASRTSTADVPSLSGLRKAYAKLKRYEPKVDCFVLMAGTAHELLKGLPRRTLTGPSGMALMGCPLYIAYSVYEYRTICDELKARKKRVGVVAKDIPLEYKFGASAFVWKEWHE